LKRKKSFKTWMIISIVLLAASAVLALCAGQYQVPIDQVISILMGKGSTLQNASKVILQVRLPRILFSMLAGAGLAASGTAFQSLFSNPLATPDTLGTANGASFGAALGILLGFSSAGIQFSAMFFGISAVLLVFAVTRTASSSNSHSIIMVILAGLVISSLFSALVTLVKYVADPNDILPVITFWLMGSFSSVTFKSLQLGAPLILIGICVLFLLRYRLNAMSLSNDEARSLGINLSLNRSILIVCASAITASVVAVCGVIGWVGLLIPHISRMLFGNDNRRVLPASIVFGAGFLLITDTIARCVSNAEIPVSILTAIIGAPVFILLLRRTGGIQV
jgi:iron complex transport system permease protein